MTKSFLYISVICNVILVSTLIAHWSYITLRYDEGNIPPLSCYQISSGYLAAHQDIFEKSELSTEQESSDTEMTSEQARAFRQSVFVQDTAEKIMALCNQDIGDFTVQTQE